MIEPLHNNICKLRIMNHLHPSVSHRNHSQMITNHLRITFRNYLQITYCASCAWESFSSSCKRSSAGAIYFEYSTCLAKWREATAHQGACSILWSSLLESCPKNMRVLFTLKKQHLITTNHPSFNQFYAYDNPECSGYKWQVCPTDPHEDSRCSHFVLCTLILHDFATFCSVMLHLKSTHIYATSKKLGETCSHSSY